MSLGGLMRAFLFRIGLALLVLFLCLSTRPVSAFDYEFDGRLFTGARYADAPTGYEKTDRDLELLLGVHGNLFTHEGWKTDYEITGRNILTGGPREQAGLSNDFESDFFRAWMRIETDDLKIRGGRQQILFGSGALFRPLGFFDTRDISGIVPLTRGVDGVRATYSLDPTSQLDGWAISAHQGDRAIVGLRGETVIGPLEAGAVMQYRPVTNLDFLTNYAREMTQLGYHFKGEYTIGYWNESRLDIETVPGGGSALRFESVVGADYTFPVGGGLHVLGEYFLSTREAKAFVPNPRWEKTYHILGMQLDQPVGISTVWRLFGFFDVRDGSFQLAPQIEYALTKQIYLYLHGRWGDDFGTRTSYGRLFRETPVFNGTESNIGVTIVLYI